MAILRKILAGIGIAYMGLFPLAGCSRNSVSHERNVEITESRDAGMMQSDFERILRESGITLAEKNGKFEGIFNMPLNDNYMLFYKPVQFSGESYGIELTPAVSDNTEILWLVFGNKIKVTDSLHPGDGIAELCAVPLGKNIKGIISDKREFTAGETPAHYEVDKEDYKITVDDDFIHLSNNYSGVYFGADNLTELRKGEINPVSPGIYGLVDPLVNGKDSLTSISMLNENEVQNSAPDDPNNLPFVALMYTTSSEIPEISQYLGPAKLVPETQEKSASQDSDYYTIEEPAPVNSVDGSIDSAEEPNPIANFEKAKKSELFTAYWTKGYPEPENYMVYYTPLNLTQPRKTNTENGLIEYSQMWGIHLISGNKIKITDNLHPGDGIAECFVKPLGKNISALQNPLTGPHTSEEFREEYKKTIDDYIILVDDDFMNLSRERGGIYFIGEPDGRMNYIPAGTKPVRRGVYQIINQRLSIENVISLGTEFDGRLGVSGPWVSISQKEYIKGTDMDGELMGQKIGPNLGNIDQYFVPEN